MSKKIVLPIACIALITACSGGGVDSTEDSSLQSLEGNSTLNATSPLNAISYDWANDEGGVFNIPPVEFNRDFYGWGSFGFNTSRGIRYNKVDLHAGSNDDEKNTMYIKNDDNALLYDSFGNVIAKAWESAIGYNHVAGERDGGIIAGAINEINIDGVKHTVVYAWSVNSNVGRQSGWIKLADLTPRDDIEDILSDSKRERDAILTASGAYGLGLYEESEIVEAYLPENLFDYYVTAGRSDDNGAGRARYYYTNVDNQYLSGLLNIPETGKQRYGVAHNALALDEKFYTAAYVDSHDVQLFPPSNTGNTSTNVKLTLAWGYSYTNTGEKIYSWINKAALSPTGKTVGGGGGSSKVVHITKRNSSGFALDGKNGATNNQNIHLWATNKNHPNQQWIELDRGNGYYSYQKMNTNHCIDGGGITTANRDNVFLYFCEANSENQQWKKVATDGGAYKLVKRSNEGFAIDGGSNGQNGQNIGLWDSSHPSHNLQWFIESINN